MTLKRVCCMRQGAGMDLRGPIIGMYAYPTVVIFCEGAGIAAARALAQAGASEGGLNFKYREDVRMYYRVGQRSLIRLWCIWLHGTISGDPAHASAMQPDTHILDAERSVFQLGEDGG